MKTFRLYNFIATKIMSVENFCELKTIIYHIAATVIREKVRLPKVTS